MGLSYAVQVIGPRVIAVPLLLTLGLALGACGSPSDTSALSPVGEPDRSGSTAITAPSGGSTSSSASDSRSPTPSASSDVPLVGAIAKDPSQDTRTNVAGTNQSGSAVDTTLNVVDASIPYGPERREQMAGYALQRYGTRTSSLRPSAIVLHFTESDDNPWSTIGYFAQNQPNGGMYPQVCAHFVLGKDGTASDPEDAVRVALKSGINMSMSDEYYSKYLPGLVKSGKVTMAELDDAARHVLNVKYDMGLFNDPYSHLGPKDSDPADTNAESRLHRKEARDVARESLVLLKNRLDTLPLKKSGTIAVVGPLADIKRDVMGSWSAAGVADQSVTVLTGIKSAVGDNAKVVYAKGANVTNDKDIVTFLNQYEEAVKVDPRTPKEMIDEAVNTAKQSDVVVAVVGEAQGMAHEASSRTDITIPQSQRDLIAALKATGKPLVLVLMNGRPLALVKEDQQADAILETWFAGTEGGNAIADVLFGDYNPSGKLPMSFPRSVGQIPVYYSHLNTGRPYNADKPNKYTSRYFDEANGPLYPFGYGLSYTTFKVSDVKMSAPTLKRDGKVTASVEVTNTGKREGATVIQMYVQDVTASMSRPVKQLRGFEKVNLKPGETQTISFPIDVEALKFWNQQMKYDAEPGKFNVFIGVDSARVNKGEFELL